MDLTRVEDFTKSHPGIEFPWFKTHSAKDNGFYSQLCQLVGLPQHSDGLALVHRLEISGKILQESDLKIFSDDIPAAFQKNGIAPQTNVFINWYRFEEIDEMRFADVLKWFPDLWYPAAEDPDIFDGSLTWILSIRHYRAFVLRGFEKPGSSMH